MTLCWIVFKKCFKLIINLFYVEDYCIVIRSYIQPYILPYNNSIRFWKSHFFHFPYWKKRYTHTHTHTKETVTPLSYCIKTFLWDYFYNNGAPDHSIRDIRMHWCACLPKEYNRKKKWNRNLYYILSYIVHVRFKMKK